MTLAGKMLRIFFYLYSTIYKRETAGSELNDYFYNMKSHLGVGYIFITIMYM